MAKHLYIAARKRRYRRIRNGSMANLYSSTTLIVFDRLEYLQQKNHAEPLAQPLDLILVTTDSWLALALTQHFFKSQHTQVCASLKEVEAWLEQIPLPRIFLDLDGVNEAPLDMLNTIRQWQKTWPQLNITQLTACRCVSAVKLINAASRFPVVERWQEITNLVNRLTQQQSLQELSSSSDLSSSTLFSNREWNILLGVAQGESLKAIAVKLNKPYHYVVYTLGRIAARLDLENNKSLIHLLNKMSPAIELKQTEVLKKALSSET